MKNNTVEPVFKNNKDNIFMHRQKTLYLYLFSYIIKQVWRMCVLSAETTDSAAFLHTIHILQLVLNCEWTSPFFIFWVGLSDISINCNLISKSLLYFNFINSRRSQKSKPRYRHRNHIKLAVILFLFWNNDIIWWWAEFSKSWKTWLSKSKEDEDY